MSKVEPSKPTNALKLQGERVSKDPSYEFKMNPRNSWGFISKIIDVLFVNCNFCGIMSNVLAWKPKDKADGTEVVKTRGQVRYAIAKYVDPPCLLNYFIVKSGLLFRWLDWNDGNINNVKDNIKTSQQHIAMVAALTLNVVAGFLRSGDSGGNSVVAGEKPYIYFFVLACIGALCSTVLAVMFLVQMNELADDIDAKIYADRMGFLLQIPIASLTISLLFTLAGISYWISYCFETWGPTVWMLGTSAPLIVPLFMLPYSFGVQTLWVVSAVANEVKKPPAGSNIQTPLLLNNNDLNERFKEYVEMTAGGMEMCNPDGFMEYLHLARDDEGNTYCLTLAYVTEERAKLFFKEQVAKFLQETKDAPARKKRTGRALPGGGPSGGGGPAPLGKAASGGASIQVQPAAAPGPAVKADEAV